ncbi:MAG: hypothetical protein ABSD77_09640, partial [Verrucomicrobiota bacterium]
HRLLFGDFSLLSNCGGKLGFRDCICHNVGVLRLLFLVFVKKSRDLTRVKVLHPRRASKKTQKITIYLPGA